MSCWSGARKAPGCDIRRHQGPPVHASLRAFGWSPAWGFSNQGFRERSNACLLGYMCMRFDWVRTRAHRLNRALLLCLFSLTETQFTAHAIRLLDCAVQWILVNSTSCTTIGPSDFHRELLFRTEVSLLASDTFPFQVKVRHSMPTEAGVPSCMHACALSRSVTSDSLGPYGL